MIPVILTVGIAIPAYRNIESLQRCLVSIRKHAPKLLASTSIVDDSGDGRIVEALRTHYPAVRWTIHEQNQGFGRSANDAVAACTADIVILLNDDVEIFDISTDRICAAFAQDDLFAATFQSLHSDGSFREGAKRLVWPWGMPRILHNPKDQRPSRNGGYRSSYAVGGHAAFHRKHFLELGGFDPMFDPFYWEDVDLSERARKRGWRIMYLPECKVIHDEGGAIRSAFEHSQIDHITLRNRLLFASRHGPPHLRLLHKAALGIQLAFSKKTRRAYAAAQIRLQEVKKRASD